MGNGLQPVAEVSDSGISGVGSCKIVANALIANMLHMAVEQSRGMKKLEEGDSDKGSKSLTLVSTGTW